jgi:hypothetical protein
MHHGKGLSVESKRTKSSLAKEDGVFGAKKQDWWANGLEERTKDSSSSIFSLDSSATTLNGSKHSAQAGIDGGIINSNEQTRTMISRFRRGPLLFPTINSWLGV